MLVIVDARRKIAIFLVFPQARRHCRSKVAWKIRKRSCRSFIWTEARVCVRFSFKYMYCRMAIALRTANGGLWGGMCGVHGGDGALRPRWVRPSIQNKFFGFHNTFFWHNVAVEKRWRCAPRANHPRTLDPIEIDDFKTQNYRIVHNIL